MSRLDQYITSDYIQAASLMRGKQAKDKIVVYVEGYDDIAFWRNVFSDIDNDKYQFEIMLPSKKSLQKGKKVALTNVINSGLGSHLIACVDADYDYLLQGHGTFSNIICKNNYVFHTYAYAIENFQCYAGTLHDVCVMATLNDTEIFDFKAFFNAFSEVIYPLFVWNVWCYRYGFQETFSMVNFINIIKPNRINIYKPEDTLSQIRSKVNNKISWLQRHIPQAKKTLKPFEQSLLTLGLTPETTYLYMRGHDLADSIIIPLLNDVSQILRRRREKEIEDYAVHNQQRINELAGYCHSAMPIEKALKKHQGYYRCALYKKILNDIQERIIERKSK